MGVRIKWESVLEHAAGIVESYDTGVTLRQLFYRLVADGTLVNTMSSYNRLARLTAEARRDGAFPALVDGTRSILRPFYFDDPQDFRDWARGENGYSEPGYRLDRWDGQDHDVLLVVEKATLVNQLNAWYGERGLRIAALRGYGSTPLFDEIVEENPDVILYVGDFDPTGEDIERDLADRLGRHHDVERIALTPEQVASYQLPPMPGKVTDPRAAGFVERHGRLIQVEVEALDPNDLQALIDAALEPYWDRETFENVVAREDRDRAEL